MLAAEPLSGNPSQSPPPLPGIQWRSQPENLVGSECILRQDLYTNMYILKGFSKKFWGQLTPQLTHSSAADQDAPPPSSPARSSLSGAGHPEQGPTASLASLLRDGTTARTTQLRWTRTSKGAPPPGRRRALTHHPRRGTRRSADIDATRASLGDLCHQQGGGGLEGGDDRQLEDLARRP
jgi:hypothetical protein